MNKNTDTLRERIKNWLIAAAFELQHFTSA
jgi:hypothetical protein